MTQQDFSAQSIQRGFGRIWLDEETILGRVIFVEVTGKGKLLIELKIGGWIDWFYAYLDYERTTQLVKILSEGLPALDSSGKGWTYLGEQKFDVTDWIGGPFDDHQGELLVGVREGSLNIILRGHPKNDGEDKTFVLDSRVAGELYSSLRNARSYLKEVEGLSDTRFEPRDLVGSLVKYEVEPLESSECPRFPPARVVRAVQGQFAQPNYIIEFAEPVMWKRKRGYDVRFMGAKIAILMSRCSDRIEGLLEKKRRRSFPLIAHLQLLKPGINPYEIKIARDGIELEGGACWGYVRLCKPRKRLLKKFENLHSSSS